MHRDSSLNGVGYSSLGRTGAIHGPKPAEASYLRDMRPILLIAVVGAAACAHPATNAAAPVVQTGATHPGEPASPPQQLLGLLGEYDTPLGMRVVLEDSGATVLRRHGAPSRGAATNVERQRTHRARRITVTVRPQRERGALRARRVGPRDDGAARRRSACAPRDRASTRHERSCRSRPCVRSPSCAPKRSPRRRRARTGHVSAGGSRRAREARSDDQARDSLRDDEQLPRHALLRRGACLHAAARGGSGRARECVAENHSATDC